MSYVPSGSSNTESSAHQAETGTLNRRRQSVRYRPESMFAELLLSDSPKPDGVTAVVVDFSPRGAGLLVPGNADSVEVGTALPVRVRYEGMRTGEVRARIVHKRRYGAFTQIGAAFDTTDDSDGFEVMEMRCIEKALFL